MKKKTKIRKKDARIVRDPVLLILCHYSEERSSYLMKSSSKMLQNLPYFIYVQKSRVAFSIFHSMLHYFLKNKAAFFKSSSVRAIANFMFFVLILKSRRRDVFRLPMHNLLVPLPLSHKICFCKVQNQPILIFLGSNDC